MRNAVSRSGTRRSPRARQAGPAMRAALQADVQQGSVLAGIRQYLFQLRGDDAGGQRGNRRRHVRGKDQTDRRGDAVRTVPVCAGPPHLHSEEDWEYRETLSGCPQGGVVSPILSNIYLHKLDEFVEQELIPQYTRGTGRKVNPVYKRLHRHMTSARLRGDRAAVRDLKKQLRAIPYCDPMDPGYRRLKYIRYADDHILGFIGPKAEAEEIKDRLAAFLRETLGLELNQQKTLITHARSQPARFLGYHIKVQHCDAKITKAQPRINGN